MLCFGTRYSELCRHRPSPRRECRPVRPLTNLQALSSVVIDALRDEAIRYGKRTPFDQLMYVIASLGDSGYNPMQVLDGLMRNKWATLVMYEHPGVRDDLVEQVNIWESIGMSIQGALDIADGIGGVRSAARQNSEWARDFARSHTSENVLGTRDLREVERANRRPARLPVAR